ncbi:hypothetical protein [Kozakia baliensis]|uniref:hypothetical protein n=1 Tax=Kozakia baliensis TaxID=153496 RepID=UPI00049634DC|nr:hypothetical protein [Kozakia baliensis]
MIRPCVNLDEERVIAMRKDGMSGIEIAKHFGVSKKFVYIILRRADLVRPPATAIPFDPNTPHTDEEMLAFIRHEWGMVRDVAAACGITRTALASWYKFGIPLHHRATVERITGRKLVEKVAVVRDPNKKRDRSKELAAAKARRREKSGEQQFQRRQRDAEIVAARERGMMPTRIAETFGISIGIVKAALRGVRGRGLVYPPGITPGALCSPIQVMAFIHANHGLGLKVARACGMRKTVCSTWDKDNTVRIPEKHRATVERVTGLRLQAATPAAKPIRVAKPKSRPASYTNPVPAPVLNDAPIEAHQAPRGNTRRAPRRISLTSAMVRLGLASDVRVASSLVRFGAVRIDGDIAPSSDIYLGAGVNIAVAAYGATRSATVRFKSAA